jgi:4-hydroxy-tetrahydrodipicolinate reductase
VEALEMTAQLRIGVAGCKGRMGRMLVQAVAESDGAMLAGGTVRPGDAWAGQDLGEAAGLGRADAPVVGDPLELFARADAVIDFTTPELTVKHAELAAQSHVALVIGTTGLDEEQQASIRRAARHTQIVQAPNMSLGVNLLLGLVQQVAAALGPAYDIEISEMHHRHKKDAPSGTALALGRAAAAGRNVVLDQVAERGRDGLTGARTSGHIGFAALRGGDVAGEHTVTFAGPGERVELSHKASSRAVFGQGAVAAALWAHRRDPGLYSMQDVLGLA